MNIEGIVKEISIKTRIPIYHMVGSATREGKFTLSFAQTKKTARLFGKIHKRYKKERLKIRHNSKLKYRQKLRAKGA